MTDEVEYKVGPGKPPLHTRFKKGETGNPLGAAHPNYTGKLSHTLKRITAAEVSDVASAILTNDREALEEITNDRKRSVLQIWVARCALKALIKGDAHTLDVILNRIVGKVPDKVEHSGPDGGPIETAEETPEQRAERLKRIDDKFTRMKALNGETTNE